MDRIKGSQHVYYQPETKRRVVVPLHKQDLPKGTLLEILKQADISKEDLRDLLCALIVAIRFSIRENIS
ncbi:MAG: type II toxin-antitoxin system HicA family toxin [Methanomicrobia archaeon]|nr:type II toxin-antitoxin system HicA family toxin [Methanomicrobia archaeon]